MPPLEYPFPLFLEMPFKFIGESPPLTNERTFVNPEREKKKSGFDKLEKKHIELTDMYNCSFQGLS